MSERFEQLCGWLSEVLGSAPGELARASIDASFRRYYRIAHAQATRIVMDAPPDREPLRPYIEVARLLSAAGLHVPEILAVDERRGFALLSDLGPVSYLQALGQPERAESLYAEAIDALVRMQAGCPVGTVGLPAYDEAMLEAETELFRDWFLGQHLGVRMAAVQNAGFDAVKDCLSEAALAQPRVFVHRDYHSRNLMVSDPNPGILDFQGAVVGPVAYDLVSLLRDCYVSWPEAQVARWVGRYREQAVQFALPVGKPREFRRWFDLTGVQRHLKAIGIFARLAHRDSKPGYLQDIPRVLDYLLDVSVQYRTLRPLRELLEQAVMPRIASVGIAPR